MGYASCAILAYALWWKKPCIKAEPSLVKIDLDSPLYTRLSHTPRAVNPETQLRRTAPLDVLTAIEDIQQEMPTDDIELAIVDHTEHVEAPTTWRSAEWFQELQFCSWAIISLAHSIFYVFAWNTWLPNSKTRRGWPSPSATTPNQCTAHGGIKSQTIMSGRDPMLWHTA